MKKSDSKIGNQRSLSGLERGAGRSATGRKSRVTATPPLPAQKTPRQLAQWAAYEKITDERAIERAAREHERRLLEKDLEGRISFLNAAAIYRDELISEVKRWTLAQDVRGYIDEVLSKTPEQLFEESLLWATWARGIAQSIDPISQRIAKFKKISSDVEGGHSAKASRDPVA